MRCSGWWDFVHATSKMTGAVASVSMLLHPIFHFYHHDAFLYISLKVNAINGFCETRWECFFIKWISAICTKRYLPCPQCQKRMCFYHLHSRIDFFSIFIRNGIEKKKKKLHSETFYSIFIRSCGPKVQRFGWHSLFNVYVASYWKRSFTKRWMVFLKWML